MNYDDPCKWVLAIAGQEVACSKRGIHATHRLYHPATGKPLNFEVVGLDGRPA
jgi:hypothetical protein